MNKSEKQLYKFKILERNIKKKFTKQITMSTPLVFVLRGWGYIETISGNKIEVQKGTMFFITSEMESYEPITDIECFLFYFHCHPEVCEQLSLERLALLTPKENHIKILEYVRPIKNFVNKVYSYHNHHVIDKKIHHILSIEFLFLLRGFYSPKTNAEFLKPLLNKYIGFRKKIDQSYRHGISVKELAKTCGMEEEEFNILFKDGFDMTPHQWLQNRRKESLRILLIENKRSFDEISQELGFQNTQQMITFCRYHLGYTPQHYRSILKEKKIN